MMYRITIEKVPTSMDEPPAFPVTQIHLMPYMKCEGVRTWKAVSLRKEKTKGWRPYKTEVWDEPLALNQQAVAVLYRGLRALVGEREDIESFAASI